MKRDKRRIGGVYIYYIERRNRRSVLTGRGYKKIVKSHTARAKVIWGTRDNKRFRANDPKA